MAAPTVNLTTTGTDPKDATTEDWEGDINTALLANYDNIDAHKADVSNPHSVTAAQVGLGQVDDTSDADKPISTATQTALDGKSDTNHGHVVGDVTGLQTALDGKSDTNHGHVVGDVTGLQTALDGKSDTNHGHVVGDVTGLQTALDGKLDASAAVARPEYPDTTAFLAIAPDGAYGLIGDDLYLNDGGTAVLQTADELLSLRRRLSTVRNVTGVAGDGATYTGITLEPGSAGDQNAMIVFSPNVANTVATPTLSINGGPAKEIRGTNNIVEPNQLQPTAFYLMVERGSDTWRIVNSYGETNIVTLQSVGGTGAAYTAITPPAAAKVTDETMMVLRPHTDNTGDCTISIDGAAAIPILDMELRQIPAGYLKSGGAAYLGLFRAGSLTLVNERFAANFDQAQDVAARFASRGYFNNAGAFAAGSSPGDYGLVNGALYKNVNGVATAQTDDELTDVRKRVGTVQVVKNITGDGATYFGDTDEPAAVTQDNTLLIFLPNVDNTVGNPTLTLNGTDTLEIHGTHNFSEPGQIRANAFLTMIRRDSRWRIVDDHAETSVVTLQSVAGDGAAYTANTPPASKRSDSETIVVFRPNITNSGACTIDIDGIGARSILDADENELSPGTLKSGGASYLGFLTASSVILLNLRDGHLEDRLAATKNEIRAADEMADRVQLMQRSVLDNPLQTGGRERDRIYLTDVAFPNGYVLSNGDLGRIINVSAGIMKYIDARNLYPGSSTPIVIEVNGECKIVTDGGIYTARPGSTIEIRRTGTGADDYLIEANPGWVGLKSDFGDPLPARDIGFLTSGQSLAERFLLGAGMRGLQRGFQDLGLYPTIYATPGATGATALVPAGAENPSNYWWDPGSNVPGPAALNWKDALDNRPAGQPLSCLLHDLGQGDAADMGTDPTLTVDAYVEAYVQLFAWMRGEANDGQLPIFMSLLGPYDENITPTDAQVSAVRWAQLQIINQQTFTHLAPWYYDLPRGIHDVHFPEASQQYVGYRLAALYENAVNGGTYGTGPYISALSNASGTEWSITISRSDPAVPFEVPEWLDYLGFFAPGEDPLTADPAEVLTQTWVPVGNDMRLDVTLSRSTGGGKLLWPYGCMTNIHRGRFPFDRRMQPNAAGWSNQWPMRPILTGAF